MALNPGELQQLSALLDDWLALPDDAAREAWLDQLPPEQQVWRPRLLAWLADAQDDAPTAALDAALAGLPGLVQSVAGPEAADARAAAGGQRLGPYRLLRLLGQGGMGSVWLAERVDGELQRAVALKLPRLHGAPASLALRFERERDILATLEHPLIARLYDAGTEHSPTGEAQPWLAMEYVDGQPITQHCDGRRASLRERVQLFLQVLQAVQFAHSRLVVHRDLKPGNILVTAEGQVRLLDFGVAKLLDEDSPLAAAATEMAAAPMTPLYASPEQMARQPIGTGSDVYSLGVVLFELLAGGRPYRLARETRGALEQAILEADPQRPSRSGASEADAALRGCSLASLQRQLRGDLDTILLKALKKSPTERYPSVAELAEDLRRWLQQEPVRAHPDSWWYRLGKLLRRHALPLGAASLAGLALLSASLVALEQARRATREAQRTQAVQAFLIGLFREAEPARAQGRDLSVHDLLQRGEQRLAAQLGAEPDLQAAITAALIGIHEELGDGRRALPLAESQLALALKSDGPGSLAHAAALMSVGQAQRYMGRNEQALTTLNEAERLLQQHPEAGIAMRLKLENRLIWVLNGLARHPEVVSRLQAHIPQLAAHHGANSWEVASAQVNLATAQAALGQHAAAAALLQPLAPLMAKGWPEQGYGVAAMRANAGYVLWQARAWPQAEAELRGAIIDMDRLLGDRNSPAIEASRTLGMVHLDAGHYAQAAEVLGGNLERSRQFHGPQDSETALNQSFAVMAWMRTQRSAEAEAAARESVRLGERIEGLSASERRGLKRRLAQAVLLNGHAGEALALADQLLAEEQAAQQGRDTRHAVTWLVRAGALNALRRPAEAAEAAVRSAQIWAALDSPAGRIGLAKARLTEALARLQAGQTEDLEALITAAEQGLARDQPAGHADHHWAGHVRARWLRAQGQTAAAERLAASSQAGYLAATGTPLPQHWPLVL